MSIKQVQLYKHSLDQFALFNFQVVACIKERSGQTELLVVDDETFKHFTEKNMEITVDSISIKNGIHSNNADDAVSSYMYTTFH